jgi:hypothetical protein
MGLGLPPPLTPPPIIKVGDDGLQEYIRGRLLDTYTPWPKQREFHISKAPYRLFGGAAGPGKTLAILFEAIKIAAQKYDQPVNTLILRRTFSELQGVIDTFMRLVPRDLYRSYNDSKHIVRWKNGSSTRFGFAAKEKDIWQYQGHEYIFVGWDELTQFTLKQWQLMSAWCRSPQGPGKMAGATNPIGPGHAWVNALWRKKVRAPGMEADAEYNPAEYEFFPATLADNPVYSADTPAGRSYRSKLDALPAHLRKALKEGRWDILAGVYFENFNAETMVIRPETMPLRPWSPRWLSIDWGFDHPAAVYWHATGEDGVTYTYREFVVRKLGPRSLAHEIMDRSRIPEWQRQNPVPGQNRNATHENISEIWLSPDAYAKRTDEDTIARQMEQVFTANNFPAPSPADNDRRGGWMLMYQMLDSGTWKLGSSCPDLVEILPQLQRDYEHDVEDILKVDGDDPADSARYGIKSRLSPGREPSEVRIARKVTSEDPTIRAIQAMKAAAAEKKHAEPIRRHPARFKPRRRR